MSKSPYNINKPSDIIQNTVGPYIDIPHPTPIQIGQDVYSYIRNLKEGATNIKFEKKEYEIVSEVQQVFDEPIGVSKLNTSLMDSLQFSVYEEDMAAEEFPPDSTTEGLNNYILDDVIITVNQRKKIVFTDIAGNNQGTVKEYIGLSDFEINITGRLSGAYGQRPVQQLIALKHLLDIGKTIGISSRYLLDLNILDVVIVSYNLPQIMGEYSTQYFTIDLVSDNKPDEVFISFV